MISEGSCDTEFSFASQTNRPYSVLLAIVINIPMLLMTGFMVQDHIFLIKVKLSVSIGLLV